MKAFQSILFSMMGLVLLGHAEDVQVPGNEIPRSKPVLDSTETIPLGFSVEYSCVLQVEEIDKVLALLIAKAESLGGWFTNRSKESIQLKIPTQLSERFMTYITTLGIPLDRSLNTTQLESERNELVSRLKARHATLEDYFTMLNASSDSTIFTIQSEIIRLQTEIEQTSNQIHKLEERMAYAEFSLHFRFQERTAPVATGRSRFPWLNRLELSTFLGGFDYVQR